MRLLSLNEFLTLPEGTVYQEYHPHYLGALCLKGDSYLPHLDFQEAELTPGCPDYAVEQPTGFGRWGLFDETARFLVYEDADRQRLVNWLVDPVKAVEEMNGDAVVRIEVEP